MKTVCTHPHVQRATALRILYHDFLATRLVRHLKGAGVRTIARTSSGQLQRQAARPSTDRGKFSTNRLKSAVEMALVISSTSLQSTTSVVSNHYCLLKTQCHIYTYTRHLNIQILRSYRKRVFF